MRKAVLILMNRVKNLVVKINEVWLVRGNADEKMKKIAYMMAADQ